jgi:hydroxymethylpyrimidine/phosphomethylpyrimidine kinase
MYADSLETMPMLAKALLGLQSEHVLLKGGHLHSKNSHDLLINQTGVYHWLKGPRIESKNTHGTGCTLSAAIASALAQGMDIYTACKEAKNYVFQAILAAKDQTLGLGQGPVHHFYHLWPNNRLFSMDKPPRSF